MLLAVPFIEIAPPTFLREKPWGRGCPAAEWAYLPHRETGERIGDGDIAIFSNNQTQTKMAATVKKDGIRKRRFAQISTKHALSTPYSLQW